MPYQRNQENYDFIIFADQTMKKCPYCSSLKPTWYEEGYNVTAWPTYAFEMGYKFRCSCCGGEIEFRCHTKSSFYHRNFKNIIMLNAGSGNLNRHLVGYVISFDDLKKLCDSTVKSAGYCVKCGRSMASGTIFCTSCGHKQKEMIPYKDDEKPCVYCGAAIKKTEAYCTKCGEKQPEQYVEKEIPSTYCVKCGYKIKEGTVFCPNCREVQNKELSKNQTNLKFCTNCGELVKEGTVFCTKCGTVQKQR